MIRSSDDQPIDSKKIYSIDLESKSKKVDAVIS